MCSQLCGWHSAKRNLFMYSALKRFEQTLTDLRLNMKRHLNSWQTAVHVNVMVNGGDESKRFSETTWNRNVGSSHELHSWNWVRIQTVCQSFQWTLKPPDCPDHSQSNKRTKRNCLIVTTNTNTMHLIWIQKWPSPHPFVHLKREATWKTLI